MKYLILALLVFAQSTFSKTQKIRWNTANNPNIFERADIQRTYITDFYKLKKSAFLKTMPWSDDYWPSYKGGISYRWNDHDFDYYDDQRIGYKIISKENVSHVDLETLSPAEKYDIFQNRFDYPLVNYERQRTKVLRTLESSPDYDASYEIPSWEGLCHGWAPATLLYKNPKSIMIENSQGLKIPFGSSDIKALLTFYLHFENKSKVSFLGKRCNLNFEQLQNQLDNAIISESEYLELLESENCRDVNAGAFHLVLTNEVSQNRGFIFDITRDMEVWNQPIYGYRYEVLAQRDASEKERAYGVHKVYQISAEVDYIVEMAPEWFQNIDHRAHSRVYYDYEIELNSKNQVIGGDWLSHDRPDFLWMRQKPTFKGYFKALEKIYNASLL